MSKYLVFYDYECIDDPIIAKAVQKWEKASPSEEFTYDASAWMSSARIIIDTEKTTVENELGPKVNLKKNCPWLALFPFPTGAQGIIFLSLYGDDVVSDMMIAALAKTKMKIISRGQRDCIAVIFVDTIDHDELNQIADNLYEANAPFTTHWWKLGEPVKKISILARILTFVVAMFVLESVINVTVLIVDMVGVIIVINRVIYYC